MFPTRALLPPIEDTLRKKTKTSKLQNLKQRHICNYTNDHNNFVQCVCIVKPTLVHVWMQPVHVEGYKNQP